MTLKGKICIYHTSSHKTGSNSVWGRIIEKKELGWIFKLMDPVSVCLCNGISANEKQIVYVLHWILFWSWMLSTVTIWILDIQILDSSEYQTLWVLSIQKVKSRDSANHLNTGHFGPLTHIFHSGFQTTIWIPDHMTTGRNSTIQIPEQSSIQMVTVLQWEWTPG